MNYQGKKHYFFKTRLFIDIFKHSDILSVDEGLFVATFLVYFERSEFKNLFSLLTSSQSIFVIDYVMQKPVKKWRYYDTYISKLVFSQKRSNSM